MRKGLLSLLALFMLLSGQQVFSCTQDGTEGIAEENDLYISTTAKGISSVTEEEFNNVLDRIEAVYKPILEAKGKTLQVIRKWSDGTVNAYAQQQGNTWKISMFGGLARHKVVTADGFALVACHELGHHLGGAPKKRSWRGNSWASNEGQSDWWGNAKCMRKIFGKDDNISIMEGIEVPAVAVKKCQDVFTDKHDLAMCKRSAMAGVSLATLLRDLRNSQDVLDFNTPDPKVVSKTDDKHPAAQCRMDTYFAGALCEVDAYSDSDDTDANIGTCNRASEHTVGLRPLCWFKPKS